MRKEKLLQVEAKDKITFCRWKKNRIEISFYSDKNTFRPQGDIHCDQGRSKGFIPWEVGARGVGDQAIILMYINLAV